MEPQQVKFSCFVLVVSSGAVLAVFITAVSSILIVGSLKSTFTFIVQMISFFMEVIVAFVAAITSGATVTLSIVASACSAAATFPASAIKGRIGVSVAVSSASIVTSPLAVLSMATLKIDTELGIAIVTAASISVSCASAWAVGVFSLIEKETHRAGLKITSVLDTVRRNNYRILRLLLKFHTGIKQRDLDQALLYAVKVGFIECTEALLSSGANPNARDSYDNTPLTLACETGSTLLSNMLIAAGADVNLKTANRGTALHKAANWGSLECIELLLLHHANPNSQDGLWRTPLMLTIMHAPNVDKTLRILLEAGSDVRIADSERRTALHYAAERGLSPDALLEARADIHALDQMDNTALHTAAMSGHSHVIASLLEAGSDASCLNNQRRTALHLAAIKGDVICLDLLHRANGMAHSQLDSPGYLPAWYATSSGHYDAVVFFIRSNCSLIPASSASSDSNKSLLQSALDRRYMKIVMALLLGGCDSALVSDWLAGLTSNPWTEEHQEELTWLNEFIQNPRDLSHSCRLTVRRLLGSSGLRQVDRLPLPRQIQDYIRMTDLKFSANRVEKIEKERVEERKFRILVKCINPISHNDATFHIFGTHSVS